MGARFSGGRLARRDEGAWPQRPVTEQQRRQTPAGRPPAGLPVFGPAAALLIGRRSTRDILPPRALPSGQIPGNAPVPHLLTGSNRSKLRERRGKDFTTDYTDYTDFLNRRERRAQREQDFIPRTGLVFFAAKERIERIDGDLCFSFSL